MAECPGVKIERIQLMVIFLIKYVNKFINSFDNCSSNEFISRNSFFFAVGCRFCFSASCNKRVLQYYEQIYCFKSQGAVLVHLHSRMSDAFFRNVGTLIQYKAENSKRRS